MLLADYHHIYRRRTFSTPLEPSLSSDRPRYHAAVQTEVSTKARIDVPPATTVENLHEIFQELAQAIIEQRANLKSRKEGKEMPLTESKGEGITNRDTCSRVSSASILQRGAKVFSMKNNLPLLYL